MALTKTELQDKIEKLEKGLATNPEASIKSIMEKRLDGFKKELEALEGDDKKPKPSTSAESANIEALLYTVLQKMNDMRLDIDEDKVKELISEQLKTMNISLDNLSPEVKAFIEAKKRVFVTIVKTWTEEREEGGAPTALDELDYVILSDYGAHNNVYLYGPSGTGKSYTAKKLAKLLNLQLWTINCNQYTSPSELIGGQTIDGFKQGKLIEAWKGGNSTKLSGALLLLDELPKIDPNTAGILNDALANVKSSTEINPKTDESDSDISDSTGEKFTRANFFCIATGNVPLSSTDSSYVANFKQDASLQDRFIGSIYRVGYPKAAELRACIGAHTVWAWSYLDKLRTAIINHAWENITFVSFRLVESLNNTYEQYLAQMKLK